MEDELDFVVREISQFDNSKTSHYLLTRSSVCGISIWGTNRCIHNKVREFHLSGIKYSREYFTANIPPHFHSPQLSWNEPVQYEAIQVDEEVWSTVMELSHKYNLNVGALASLCEICCKNRLKKG